MDHDAVVMDIEMMLDAPVSEECCIYRVPFHIRRINEDAYTPKVVSIGPFHHGRPPHLQNMEGYKLIYCKAFIQRHRERMHTLVSCIEEEILPDFRRCYSDTLEFTEEELVKMILVDSGFILELFWRYYYKEDHKLLSKPWLATNIRLDLLLLENQLPFFVLDRLYNLSYTSVPVKGKIRSFIELTFDYFEHYNRSKLPSDNITIMHFTDLIRTFHLQRSPEKRSPRKNLSMTCLQSRKKERRLGGKNKQKHEKYLRSATELVEAGVRFQVNTENSCLLDFRFSGRVLEIPELIVEDWTEVLFRNMVALEQCHYPYKAYITDYIAVWDFLINTSRDVDVLVRNKILVHWLGDSDSVANLFNSLWKNITHSNFNSDYLHLFKDLNDYCTDTWHELRATLRRDYGGSPWQTVASIGGIVILILTLIGTVCAVLQVVQQYKPS